MWRDQVYFLLIESISEFHRLLSLPAPLHPLVSVINVKDVTPLDSNVWAKFAAHFYSVSIKHDVKVKVKYGQLDDLNSMIRDCGSSWMLLFHADSLYGHPLGTTIKNYGYFSYEFNEALHLSEKGRTNPRRDLYQNRARGPIHRGHTQNIILTQIELLLQYCDRFYQRQFITRKKAIDALLVQLEKFVNQYFDSQTAIDRGLPSLEDIASQLNISPRYMSDMLRILTGQRAQQHTFRK
ncbi:MAG: hypothetical protein BGO21_30785 [Dyadobacter sp. 50-39]|nr:MAG: hypothetical protein BGO21_30785 [Dyadobacter sp. 50-39]